MIVQTRCQYQKQRVALNIANELFELKYCNTDICHVFIKVGN